MAGKNDAELDRLEVEERQVDLKRKALQAEREELELEVLRDQVAKLHAQKEQKKMSHAQVETALQDFQVQQERGFAECNHRKGGKNLEGARGRGTDDKYAVIRHQLPFGQWMVLCTRCHKVWLPPDIAERMGRKPDPDGYKEALEWNTDNEPSGSSLFIVIGGKEIQKW